MSKLNQFNQEELIAHLEAIPRQERIVTLRGIRGLSQSKLAKILNVSRATIAAWETSAESYGSLPTRRNRTKLAIYFGVPAKVFTDEWGARALTPAEKRMQEMEERKRREEIAEQRRLANTPRNLRPSTHFNPAAAERRREQDGRNGRGDPPPGVKRIG
jgi:transcriptional regulator with XRE-family HTH domain